MKTAYLIDKDAVGGGMEYIRRQIARHSGDESRVFFSDRGECTAAKMNAWGADVIHVNHLKALLQLFRNPFARPRGKVVFTVQPAGDAPASKEVTTYTYQKNGT